MTDVVEKSLGENWRTVIPSFGDAATVIRHDAGPRCIWPPREPKSQTVKLRASVGDPAEAVELQIEAPCVVIERVAADCRE